jgi:3-oxoacyl-[acyl-carrier protein] reductase
MAIPASFDLSGRVAVVTGAGSPDGIGFAAARLLAELGAALMIGATTSRVHDRVSELRAAGHDAAGVAGDLTDAVSASGLVSAALDRWGRLDILVNNAGMISAAVPVFESGTVESMDLPTWQAALGRNLTTAFLVTKAALPAMISRRWGRVIMVASVTGPVMAIRADVGYATAKAGMVGLTRAAAVDAAKHAITVNAVAPGWIATGSQTPDERDQGRASLAGQPRRLLCHRPVPGRGRRQLNRRTARRTRVTRARPRRARRRPLAVSRVARPDGRATRLGSR